MALEDTVIIAKSAGSGRNGWVLVPKNAAQLGAALTSGATAWTVNGDNPFNIADVCWIGEEKVLVGDPVTGITRGNGGTTPAAHPKYSNILPDEGEGTVLLNHTFNGTDKFTALRVKGHAPAQFDIFINGSYFDSIITSINYQEGFYPLTEVAPADTDDIIVRVLNWHDEALFQATIIN